jgi:hypothetical protein
MAALGFFTKTSLVLSPLVVGVGGCLVRHRGRESVTRLLLLAAGFAVVAAVVLAWIILLDDAGRAFRQTLEWPSEYKRAVGKGGLSWASVGNLFALLHAGRLQWLYVGSVAGLFYGWKRGAGRLALFLALLLLGECLRVVVEGEPWHYTVSGMVAPMVMGCAFFCYGREGRTTMCGVGVTLVLLIPMLVGALPDAARATRLRLVEHAKTPLEVLTDLVAPHYRSGEQIMVNGQDYQLLLHLDAPPPYPVLPLHMHAVSDEAREKAEHHFRRHPPEWIIDSRPVTSPVAYRCIGQPDALAYAYVPVEDSELKGPRTGLMPGARYPVRRPVTDLPSGLLREYPYYLVVDTGLHQAWRLSATP